MINLKKLNKLFSSEKFRALGFLLIGYAIGTGIPTALFLGFLLLACSLVLSLLTIDVRLVIYVADLFFDLTMYMASLFLPNMSQGWYFGVVMMFSFEIYYVLKRENEDL